MYVCVCVCIGMYTCIYNYIDNLSLFDSIYFRENQPEILPDINNLHMFGKNSFEHHHVC